MEYFQQLSRRTSTLKRNILALSVGAMALLTFATVGAQRSAPAKKKVAVSSAETGLAGIKLFDSGVRVVAIFGSPTMIEAVSIGGGNGGSGGGAAGGAGGRGLPGAGGGGNGAPGTATAMPGPGAGLTFPGLQFSPEMDRQSAATMGPVAKKNPGNGGGSKAPGAPISDPGSGGNPGGGVSGGGSMVEAQYTRWVYNRTGVKYGFILDKYNRVVQCEAIGLTSGKAKTRRGVTFGTSFASIIKKYGAPDGYEVGGNTIIVRYLNKAKCAFQLSRLADNKPHVVTGIVVAAGKR